jgi:hypothetical protein
MRGEDFLLAFNADSIKHNMARVTQQLLIVHKGRCQDKIKQGRRAALYSYESAITK